MVKKIWKEFIWSTSTPKIKDRILLKSYGNGSLKNADIPSKKNSF